MINNEFEFHLMSSSCPLCSVHAQSLYFAFMQYIKSLLGHLRSHRKFTFICRLTIINGKRRQFIYGVVGGRLCLNLPADRRTHLALACITFLLLTSAYLSSTLARLSLIYLTLPYLTSFYLASSTLPLPSSLTQHIHNLSAKSFQ